MNHDPTRKSSLPEPRRQATPDQRSDPRSGQRSSQGTQQSARGGGAAATTSTNTRPSTASGFRTSGTAPLSQTASQAFTRPPARPSTLPAARAPQPNSGAEDEEIELFGSPDFELSEPISGQARRPRESQFQTERPQQSAKPPVKKIEVAMRYEDKPDWLGRVLLLMMVVGAALGVYAGLQIGKLPEPAALLEGVKNSPVIEEAASEAKQVTVNGQNFSFHPQHQVRLSALVLSKLERSEFSYTGNKASVNALHVGTLCAVSGQTAASGLYQKLKMDAGVYDCVVANNVTSNSANNASDKAPADDLVALPLLTDSAVLARRFDTMQVGDQISVEGQVGGFAVGENPTEAASFRTALRSPILLSDFHVEKRGSAIWRQVIWGGVALVTLPLVILLLRGLFMLISDVASGNTKPKELQQLGLAERKRKEAEDRHR